MNIKILGTGCQNCMKLEANVKKSIGELGIKTELEKVTDMAKIISYGVMNTPALVIDEIVMSSGKIPDVASIKEMIQKKEKGEQQAQDKKCTGGCSCEGKC